MDTIFIYSKDKKIKVLNYETAKLFHSSMIEDGWKHTHTLNPCLFIDSLLLKTDEEIINAIKKLKN